jgi:lipopolysaccharide export LptBFGC system permease protein LptF
VRSPPLWQQFTIILGCVAWIFLTTSITISIPRKREYETAATMGMLVGLAIFLWTVGLTVAASVLHVWSRLG